MVSSTLNGDIIFQKGYFELLGNTHILFYCPIVSPWKIEVYTSETLDMGKIPLTSWCQWNMQIQVYPQILLYLFYKVR